MSHAIAAIDPPWALPGARVAVIGGHLPLPPDGPPHVSIGGVSTRVVGCSSRAIRVIVPADVSGPQLPVRIEELPGEKAEIAVARVLATGVHQVDSPAFDAAGRLWLTQSGGRDSKAPVPLYRVGDDEVREPVAVAIANPTSIALAPDGSLYVSSRFEGHVYRITPDDRAEIYVTEVGVPTGLAFAPDGTMFVGDRSGSILRVTTDRRVDTFATLPSSVAAFHLAYGPDDCLYVTAPTLSTHDAVYRISPDRLVDVIWDRFGRPQGLAFDANGTLYVVDALAGAAGLYRLDIAGAQSRATCVLSAPSLIGVAFDPSGGVILASNDTIWKLDVPMRPRVFAFPG